MLRTFVVIGHKPSFTKTIPLCSFCMMLANYLSDLKSWQPQEFSGDRNTLAVIVLPYFMWPKLARADGMWPAGPIKFAKTIGFTTFKLAPPTKSSLLT